MKRLQESSRYFDYPFNAEKSTLSSRNSVPITRL